MPNIEPLTCGACGSDWFRLATFRKSSLALFLPVCLCGTIAPEPARKVLPFGTVIGRTLGQAMAAVESLPDAAAGAILAHRIGRLEHSCLLIQRRLFPRLSIRPKTRLPVRRAATHGLDAIALDLQRTGLLNFRQARKVVRGVIDAWKAALATGESVRTPAGVLLVRTLRSGCRRIALRPAAQLRSPLRRNGPAKSPLCPQSRTLSRLCSAPAVAANGSPNTSIVSTRISLINLPYADRWSRCPTRRWHAYALVVCFFARSALCVAAYWHQQTRASWNPGNRYRSIFACRAMPKSALESGCGKP